MTADDAGEWMMTYTELTGRSHGPRGRSPYVGMDHQWVRATEEARTVGSNSTIPTFKSRTESSRCSGCSLQGNESDCDGSDGQQPEHRTPPTHRMGLSFRPRQTDDCFKVQRGIAEDARAFWTGMTKAYLRRLKGSKATVDSIKAEQKVVKKGKEEKGPEKLLSLPKRGCQVADASEMLCTTSKVMPTDEPRPVVGHSYNP
ncbi:hypothetical protein FB45DRAFT_1001127 [Roridomyces roridus]|uniref:Uncharacterized protein n=1 Tax=Roridomyces roridus TaxID=1738132 RepID=A0AAD7C533_9AGAR|nr:hypothetical protein FB45DRAFT_1001127 [Roridomyces roridus]